MHRFRSAPLTLRLLLSCSAVVALATGLILSLARVHAQEPAATYTRGILSVDLPFHSTRSGSGKLVTEILDPEDKVLGRTERTLDIPAHDGSWRQSITPTRSIAFDEIIWQRLRYTFTYAGDRNPSMEWVDSISQILRRPVVRILGQTEYLTGSTAAIRVIVADATQNPASQSATAQPITSGTVRIELLASGAAPRPLFSGHLNQRGTLEAQLHFPTALTGKADLRFIVDTPIGSTEYTQPVTLADKASILLTAEKPIYQPSQVIHARALALDRAAHKAQADRPLTFELEDSRGNKVFKRATQTDAFGIASAEFALADEVNLGTYHLRALMGDSAAPSNSAEIALNVQRYVLPKFKVSVELAPLNGKPKRDFRPGDHVTGTVRANYFFGKPVDRAEVTLKVSGMDVAVFEAASLSGRTDTGGAFHFDLKLPAYFAGRPLSQGAARALVEASVKDSATHTETRGEPITISQSSLLITAVPEGGSIIPHLDNQVFILTSYPDGTPAAGATLRVQARGEPDQQASADPSGVALIHIHSGTGVDSLHIDADDRHGARATLDAPLQLRAGADQILLRTSRAIVRTGDRIQLNVLSTRAQGSAYIDIVNNGQTILTRDLDLNNGHAELNLIATPEMAGTLDIDAYLFGRDAQPIADHRLLFVQPADELHIAASTDAPAYKPGDEARLHFHVTNSQGEGVSAALGLQIVDEAVFALAEKQPGFAKVFFYLEQEVMKPRYEIHSFTLANVIEPAATPQQGDPDLAARALFSATEMASPAALDTEFGRSLPRDRFEDFHHRYQTAFANNVRTLAASLSPLPKQHVDATALAKAFHQLHPQDAWGTPLRLEPTGWNQAFFRVRSAGPDREFNTADDLNVYLQQHSAQVNRAPPTRDAAPRGTIDLRVEHGRAHAEVMMSGRVTDLTGAVIPNATVTLRFRASSRTTRSDASGSFSFTALPAGSFALEITAPGFFSSAREFTLQPGDNAVLTSNLSIGNTTQTVEVSTEDAVFEVVPAPPPPPRMMMLGAAMAGAPRAASIDGNGQFFDAKAVAALPMMARSFMALRKAEASAPAQADAPHVRSYFPEALYINPEIITDGHGDASISLPVADSITTWRMAMIASSRSGALGTGTGTIKVFQDFFADLDLPVTLTQGDRVSLPVAIYNYTGTPGQASLALSPDPWYTLDNDSPGKTVAIDSNQVGGAQFSLIANRIGKFKLTLTAHMGNRSDIVVREIEVIPDGREQSLVFNGRLENSMAHDLRFPATSIPDASSILLRLYPGPLSQVIEGMDSILRMPGGCFEQTSSSTYPNVLALDYMKRTKKLTPEVHAKAEGYIANGYQRLLTFEVPGGGFSWFGQAPANKILTAYGLMEFNDMAHVSDVDPRLIQRTADWLARQQQPDGSWKPDTSFINEGATNRYNSDVLRITAYIAWALANTGYTGPAAGRAKDYIAAHASSTHDAYTLAIIANFAADLKPQDRDFTRRAMQALLDSRTEKGDLVSWSTPETGVYATGESAAIETSGLAAQALLKWGQASETVRKALAYISSKKQASGNWGTTQATIMALRALLLASQLSTSDTRGTVQVLLNGKQVESLTLTRENNDLLHQFVFKSIDPNVSNHIELQFSGSGGLAYQVVGRYFTPWDQHPAAEPLSIDVAYDRTSLAQNDLVTASATIRNNTPGTANMIMVDLGIPPGFELLNEDLQTFQEKTAAAKTGRLEKFSLTATQAILYFNSLASQQTVTLSVRLRAKYPIRARTFQSRVYEYYDPSISAIAQPAKLEVVKR